MPRFAANLTFLFTELPFLDRFAAAKRAGFDGVEVLFPYETAVQEIQAALRDNQLTYVLQNAPPPNWTGGVRGFAALPQGEHRFRYDFDRATRWAQFLKPEVIHVMAGRASGLVARATYVKNLKWAAGRTPRQMLTIEPINANDMPGYYLDSFDLAASILDEVSEPNLKLQFDAYHAQTITGDAIATWRRYYRRVAHVQIAGYPGRAEPQGGEIDYTAFFAELDQCGYRGWVSAEYTPAGRTAAGLDWLHEAVGGGS